MKAYHQTELEYFLIYAEEKLKGAQLQDIDCYDNCLSLGFYQRGQGTIWFVLDLNNNTPMALLFNENPFRGPKTTRPVSLFLNSHGKNLYVQRIEHKTNYGRVFEVVLATTGKECGLEVQLIPKAANFIVRSGNKFVAWNKPKELIKVDAPQVDEVRSINAIHEEWLSGLKRPSSNTVSPLEKAKKKIEKDLEKKKKALSEINKTIESTEAEDWYELGELLKIHKLEEIDREWDVFLDRQRSHSWNREQVFQKAKSFEKKKQGTLERKNILEKEIALFEEKLRNPETVLEAPRQGSPQVARKIKLDTKARKKQLTSGKVAYLGKSAADNMKILRQSQSWDIWLHLRDYPSAHAIIHQNKNDEVSGKELEEVALWLAQESLQKKVLMPGIRLEVVWVQCRHVKPIKGDKLGRVHYHNESHFNLVIPG